jgi:hypothetical protein
LGNVAETLRIGKTVTDWSRAGQARDRDPCRYYGASHLLALGRDTLRLRPFAGQVTPAPE